MLSMVFTRTNMNYDADGVFSIDYGDGTGPYYAFVYGETNGDGDGCAKIYEERSEWYKTHGEELDSYEKTFFVNG